MTTKPIITPRAINTVPRHFLTVCDLSSPELDALFVVSQAYADAFRERAMPQTLKGKRVALSFEDGGFRNRVAFELGIREMGGCLYSRPPRRAGARGRHGPLLKQLVRCNCGSYSGIRGGSANGAGGQGASDQRAHPA